MAEGSQKRHEQVLSDATVDDCGSFPQSPQHPPQISSTYPLLEHVRTADVSFTGPFQDPLPETALNLTSNKFNKTGQVIADGVVGSAPETAERPPIRSKLGPCHCYSLLFYVTLLHYYNFTILLLPRRCSRCPGSRRAVS